jgi:hypothetical protein
MRPRRDSAKELPRQHRFKRGFDRVLNSLHAVSAVEEAWVKGRTRYLIIAALLTIFNGTVTVRCGVAMWKASSADIWGYGDWALFAALGATSLVNVWVEAVQNLDASLCGRNSGCMQSATAIPVQVQGQADV